MRLVYFFFSETVVGIPSWVFIQSMCTWSSFLAKSGWSFLYSSSASFFACATISAVGWPRGQSVNPGRERGRERERRESGRERGEREREEGKGRGKGKNE
eukprot:2020171-Rhodomonas_salina.1